MDTPDRLRRLAALLRRFVVTRRVRHLGALSSNVLSLEAPRTRILALTPAQLRNDSGDGTSTRCMRPQTIGHVFLDNRRPLIVVSRARWHARLVGIEPIFRCLCLYARRHEQQQSTSLHHLRLRVQRTGNVHQFATARWSGAHGRTMGRRTCNENPSGRHNDNKVLDSSARGTLHCIAIDAPL